MKKVLTINVPFTVDWAIPYGSAVVNGILKFQGYDVQAWDLSIDFTNKYKHLEHFDEFYVNNTTGGYVDQTAKKSWFKKFVKLLRAEIKQKLQRAQPDIV